MTPLDRKFLRDLWRMKGQAFAIALVIALGVLLLIMMDGLFNSLDGTREAYYHRYRLADVFAPLKRAPNRLLDDLAKINGVATVEGRVTGRALINMPDIAVPLSAQAVSLPDFGMPGLNDIYLSAGRRIDPSHEDEIILLQGFADAHGLKPGDRLSATMNGARRTFRIVGLAQSPEFLYSAPPGEFIPDDTRFAVIWMSETALAAAYDMRGAFNEALLSLARNANLTEVLRRVDLLLERSGSIGAYGLADQVSNRFISEEINGLHVMGRSVPPVFLAVAAFLLNIVVTRMIQSEREQIGLLKAFGYSSFEVGVHYFKFILAVSIGGAVMGCLLGVASGRSLLVVYQAYYKFPFLIFQIDPRAFAVGFMVSVLAASAGGIFVLRSVFLMSPAVAMRPPAPADFSRLANFSNALKSFLDQPTRMVIRHLVRQPIRALGTVIGIASGMALSVAMLSVMASFDETLELNFNVIDRSDLSVNFVHPHSDKTIFELQSIEGVIEVEPVRSVAAVLHNGLISYRGAISGLVKLPRLFRAVGADLKALHLPKGGIILGAGLADVLKISSGQTLSIEIREGRRPLLQVPVVGVAETLIGSPAYMELGALNSALKEPGRVSGAYLRIDKLRGDEIYRAIKDMPSVGGVSLKGAAQEAFKKLLNEGAGSTRYFMAAIAAIITFGIVYNSARIGFAERARDLASLRVIGFTRGEAAFILLGELATLTLIALPIGALLGYYLSFAISKGFSTDLYQIPTIFSPAAIGIALSAVVISAVSSGWLVKRELDNIDLVTALKTRE